MSSSRVRCPNGHLFICDNSHLGRKAWCSRPSCDEPFTLIAEPPEQQAVCPDCAAPLNAGAVRCTECGRYLDPRDTREPPVILPEHLAPARLPPDRYHWSLGEVMREERAKAQAKAEAKAEADAEEPRTVEAVLTELTRGRKRRGWLRGALVLGVSALAFVALGLFWLDPLFLLALVPILFIHELGHWVAMRAFGYRDMNMFFIPFFGAAVSGTNPSPEGWQRAVVALAGPVPSLVIGHALVFASVALEQEMLAAAGFTMVLLNALNLLPLFPLDGGHFFNTMFFARWEWTERMSRLVAAVLFLAVGLWFGGWVTGFLGVITLLSLGSLRRVQCLVRELRTELGEEALGPVDRVPEEVARKIIPRVFEQTSLGPPAVAGIVEDVWMRLRLRSPGVVATLALLLVYGVAWLSVLLVPAIVLLMIERGSLPEPTSGFVHDMMVGFRKAR